MSGCANNDGFSVLCTKLNKSKRCSIRTEINYNITAANNSSKIVATIYLADNLNVVTQLRSTSDECLSHAAFRAGYDDSCHIHSKTPHRFIVVRSTSQFFGFIGTSGRRYSSSINFIIASAAFTGVGFVSMNKSLN